MTQGTARDEFQDTEELLGMLHPAALAVVTPGGRIAYWNRAAVRMFGYEAAEVRDRLLEELLVPADRRAERREAYREAMEAGSACFVSERQRKDGTRLPVRVTLDVVADGSGAADRIIVSMWDLRRTRCLCSEALAAGPRPAQQSLTSRQQQVLRMIAEGRSTKEIAKRLELSAKTVETHRVHLMQRLHLKNVAGLVRYAVAIGLVPRNPWATGAGATTD